MDALRELMAAAEAAAEETVALLQELVRIPSVNTGFMPTGDETPVCRLVQRRLAEDGIEAEVLEAAPNRGNVIARLEGRSGRAGLMFMSHTDVVPVEDESRWRFPPFSATVHRGRIYGRGASDCKGLLAAQMMAMRILKRQGVPLRDGLILASGADEEHGGRYGFGWLAREHPEKITAPAAVNEGGGTPVEAAGGLAYLLGVGEKGRLQVEIDVAGSSAHASVPWQGRNAFYGLAQVLARIRDYEPRRDTSAEIFRHLSSFAIEDVPSPENIDGIIARLEGTNPRLASLLRALSRMTLTPTMLRGGIKSNSVPETVRLTCDVRTLPHQDDEYVRGELERLLEGIPGVRFEIDYMAVPNASPFDTDLARSIAKATEVAVGRPVRLVPALSTGFTDSRFTRPLGVVTYGFYGTHPDDDPMLSRVHGTDESIAVASLVTSTKVMLALAYDLLAEK